uniref:glucuronosyltransferase n=1 Tax=Acrobeloides nanus TaxID=290746 RepID=A0A914D3A4_9BILA
MKLLLLVLYIILDLAATHKIFVYSPKFGVSHVNFMGKLADILVRAGHDVEEVAKSSLYFANVDEHVDFPRPISHKVVYMGGTGKVKAKPLEKKFEDIMQKSKKGVILVSFGSVALSINMPQEVKQVFLETFKKFPDVTFLWKYEKDEHKIAEGYQNVVTDKWVPQNDLLEHPKLLGFVSHGGMNSVQEGASKGVPMKFEDIMQKSKKGVILVSFGTVALSHSMPQEVKQVFLETFKKFPDVTFLWKYEKDEHKIAEGYKNVVTDKWVPQNDLLGHPKLLGFVSHGGMNSVQEGSSKGVPMVMIPLFADQYRNSKMLEYRKMAVVLDRKELTVEKLTEALKKIIEDNSYRKNAKRISALISAKPIAANCINAFSKLNK